MGIKFTQTHLCNCTFQINKLPWQIDLPLHDLVSALLPTHVSSGQLRCLVCVIDVQSHADQELHADHLLVD